MIRLGGVGDEDALGHGLDGAIAHAQVGLGLPAYGDVADVALDDPPAVDEVDVADELDLGLASVVCLQRQVVVADVVVGLELGEGGLGGLGVLEGADLPELLADEIVTQVSRHLRHERVDVDDAAGARVEDQDAVLGRLEEAAISSL